MLLCKRGNIRVVDPYSFGLPLIMWTNYLSDILYKEEIIRSHLIITLPLLRSTWSGIFATLGVGVFCLWCYRIYFYGYG
jgi:hypothetical protein